MSLRVLDVGLDNLHLIPKECLNDLSWELPGADPSVDPRFYKEEWFSSTLLEWGGCGKLLVEDEQALAFAQYAPATLFPRVAEFPAGRAVGDGAYLAICYVVEGARGVGHGTELVRAVARDLVDRGYRALEALGDRDWDGGSVLPFGFLTANGFTVVHEDPRHPLLRLDLRARMEPLLAVERAAQPLAAP
jgi:GNAT superfamily N-acetyltransferase